MQSNEYISFKQWVKQRRLTLFIALGVIVIQFFIFKRLYPFPNFLPDSYSYIGAAVKQQHINLWPIGYSRFLWFFRLFTRDHVMLVWLQYGLLQIAIGYFVLTVSYLLLTGKRLFRIMLFAALCNPLTYQISNLVSSDALFTILSLCWVTQLLWIVFKSTFGLLLLHAVVLLLVFTVRYNALYFPLISLAALVFTTMSKLNKLTGIIAIVLLLGAFIGYTQFHYKKETGSAQFSPFGGWQMASNALFAYAHVPATDRVKKDYWIKQLKEMVDRHMDSLHTLQQRPDAQLGVYYLWNEHSPLKQFMYYSWRKDSTTDGFARWALMGPRYKEYGFHLIATYPAAFMQYYVRPNVINYYVPTTEFLGYYNMGKDTIDKTAVNWFRLKNNKIYSKISPSVLNMNRFIPVGLALINLLFVAGCMGFLWLKGFRSSNGIFIRVCGWLSLVWFCNIGFSVFASPIVLRYQLYPMLITQTFLLCQLGFIIRQAGYGTANPLLHHLSGKAIPRGVQ